MRFIFYIFILFSFTSCLSLKNTIYFNQEEYPELKPPITGDYRLRPQDMLNIDIYILGESDTKNYLSKGQQGGMGGGQQGANLMLAGEAGTYFQGYTISDSGYIRMPLLGKLHVATKTTKEIESQLEELLREYFREVTVSVKMSNFKVYFFGEFNRPGMQFIFNDKLNLLEGLALAGDLTNFGDRKNLKLVRTLEDRSKQVHVIDLTNVDFINSELYYLYPGDVIYAQPVKAKGFVINAPILSFIITTTTFLLLIYNTARNF